MSVTGTVFPHSRLWVSTSRSVVISGPHIQVLNTLTGDTICSTALFSGGDKDTLLKSGPVRCVALDTSETYLATVGDDKILKVWSVDGLKLLNTRELPKKPTTIRFTQDSQTILVSDKFGDVFGYSLHPADPSAPPAKGKRDSISSHENPSGGQLILGHASLLTSFLLTFDERYIITADRDEHIRVSWYPQGYSIEMFCLGHEKFVSAIHIPFFSPSSLISGGGDPMLKIWDWMSGKVTHEIEIFDSVKPFIKVKGSKRKQGEDDDDVEGTLLEGNGRMKGKGKGKGEGKGTTKKEGKPEGGKDIGCLPESVVGEGGKHLLYVDADVAFSPTSDVKSEGEGAARSGNIVIVVHKIDTLTSEQGHCIIFSVVGGTALFTCQYPDGNITPIIKAFDLGKPIIDFVVAEDKYVWTMLDSEWAEKGSEVTQGERKMVTIAAFAEGQLVESTEGKFSALLSSFNSKCLLPASASDLKTLDIYAFLSSMPKNAEVEYNPMNQDFSETGLGDHEDNLTEKSPGKMSKKKLGRLKNKRALMAKAVGGEKSVSNTGEEDGPEKRRTKLE